MAPSLDMRKHLRRLTLAALFLALASAAADAQGPVALTPDEYGQIRAMAIAAQRANWASPERALRAFEKEFERTYGRDVPSPQAAVHNTAAISINFITPLTRARMDMSWVLVTQKELTQKPRELDRVTLLVSVRQPSAPTVQKVVLSRDAQEIAPVENGLEVKPLKLGTATISKPVGFVAFPLSAFAPGAVVKLLVVTDGQSYEWQLDPRKPFK